MGEHAFRHSFPFVLFSLSIPWRIALRFGHSFEEMDDGFVKSGRISACSLSLLFRKVFGWVKVIYECCGVLKEDDCEGFDSFGIGDM